MSSTNFALLVVALAVTVVHLALASRIASKVAGFFRSRVSAEAHRLDDAFVDAVMSSRAPHSLRMG
jgi:hypothetical protein